MGYAKPVETAHGVWNNHEHAITACLPSPTLWRVPQRLVRGSLARGETSNLMVVSCQHLYATPFRPIRLACDGHLVVVEYGLTWRKMTIREVAAQYTSRISAS